MIYNCSVCTTYFFQAGLQDALPFVDDIAEQLPTLLSAEDVAVPLEMAVFTSLWGNKMDLSLWPSKSVSAKDNNVTISSPTVDISKCF